MKCSMTLTYQLQFTTKQLWKEQTFPLTQNLFLISSRNHGYHGPAVLVFGRVESTESRDSGHAEGGTEMALSCRIWHAELTIHTQLYDLVFKISASLVHNCNFTYLRELAFWYIMFQFSCKMTSNLLFKANTKVSLYTSGAGPLVAPISTSKTA